MKHLFIINPAAGSRDRTKEYKKAIVEACQGLDYRVEVSAGPGDCTRLAAEAAETPTHPARAIICVQLST